jgi:transposase
MDVLFTLSCCSLDVQKWTVVACLIKTSASGQAENIIRIFGTMTDGRLVRVDWLASAECTSVARESTSMYWKLTNTFLEGRL